MNSVQIIEPNKRLRKIEDGEHHHVCAYCRVSTSEDDQRNSLASQEIFFSRYFANKPNWTNVGIFADEGLSGTSLEKRDRFNAMLYLARQGKIDIILTKEVSRFSRNVQDLLNIVVELRNLQVFVWFLSDDIYTEDDNYREKLVQIATNAEQESLRTSRRVKWGQQQQMQRGIVFGPKEMFGYKIMRNESFKQDFVIIPDEAEIVKKIYEWFSAGDAIHTISDRLNQLGILTKRYSNGWSCQVILRILKNEKYVGDLSQGKTYTPDPLTHKKKYNHGEYYRYYIKDHHIPIVDRDVWDKVQGLLNERELHEGGRGKNSNRYWCSGKVICGLCGNHYICITKQQKRTPYRAWGCIENHRHGRLKETISINGERGNSGCNAKRVNDRVLRLAVYDIIERIMQIGKDEIYDEICRSISRLKSKHNEDSMISIKQIDLEQNLAEREFTDVLLERLIKRMEIYPDNTISVQLIYMKRPVFMRYKTSGKGETYSAEFEILTETEAVEICNRISNV